MCTPATLRANTSLGNGHGTVVETFAPVYYPEPEEGYGEGGAAPAPIQVEKVELVDEPPEPKILEPPRDWDYGHRTLFFRDPEGNILEIYAEI